MTFTTRRFHNIHVHALPGRRVTIWPIEMLENRIMLDSTTVFNEIMYHPTDDQPTEWIELHNQMAVNMDLSGWSITGGITYHFIEETIIPGRGHLVIAADPVAMGDNVPTALGPWTGRLANGGEELQLRDNNNRLMNVVDFDDGGDWPVAPDGSGVTLAKRDESMTNSDSANNWMASYKVGGTPGTSNFTDTPPLSPIVINELGGVGDGFFVELTNVGQTVNDIGGLVLQNDQGQSVSLDSELLAPGQFVSVPTSLLGFSTSVGGRITVHTNDGMSVLDSAIVEDRGRGRSPDGKGDWQYTSGGTPAQRNAFEFHDAIVINEIMYHHRPDPSRAHVPATYMRTEHVSLDNTWRYNAAGDELPADWSTKQHSLGDNWQEGFGLLGFSNRTVPTPGIGTEIVPGDDPPITFYFETDFDLSGEFLQDTDIVEIQHVIDDGSVFYLNGTEISRFNIDGEVTPTTKASRSITPTHSELFSVPVNLLRSGTNRLSVEVHQRFARSADMVFGMRLVTGKEFEPEVPAVPFREIEEEWIELINRSEQSVDISGWKLDDAIEYEFPVGTIIDADGLLVVARDVNSLKTTYPTLFNVLGNFRRRLSNREDRIRLLDANGNLADEVRYFDGGRWSELADGVGSSLELIDSRSDNSFGEAWQASDEGAKSTWTTYTYSGAARKGISLEPTVWHEFALGFLDGAGEALIDDISVVEDPNGNAIELIQNGGFDSGTTEHWRLLGNHQRSRVIDDNGNYVLNVIASGATEYQSNQLETTLVNEHEVINGFEYRVSFRAKWLSGSQQINSRLYFNRLSRTTVLDVPENNGTPGRPNSRRLNNSGPTFDNLRHSPVLPTPDQPITISVQAHDPDQIQDVVVWYKMAEGDWFSLPMKQNAMGYEAVLPGQSAGSVIQFYVEARDTLGASTMFPAAGPDSRALLIVDDGQNISGPLTNLRLIMTASESALLHQPTNSLSNERLGSTVIYGNDVFYDTGVRLKGSFVGRNAARVGFNIVFHPDHKFRGVHQKLAVDRSTHAVLGVDELLIKQVANRAGGIPSMYDDLAYFVSPFGQHTNVASLRMAGFDAIYLDSQFENGSDGTVYEYEVIRWATTTIDRDDPESLKRQGGLNDPNGFANVDFGDYGDDKEVYRWVSLISTNRTRDNYQPMIRLNQTLALGGQEFEVAAAQVMDVDQWLRTLAYQSLVGPADAAYTGGAVHNFRIYARPNGKVLYLPWDWDSSFQQSTRGALIGGGKVSNIVRVLPNTRSYYFHMLDIIKKGFNAEYMSYWTNHYGLLADTDFSNRLDYIDRRAQFVIGRIQRDFPQTDFSVNGAPVVNTDHTITVRGSAWFDIADIRLSGNDTPLNITWDSETTFRVTMDPDEFADGATLESYDRTGRLISSATMPPLATVGDFNVDGIVDVADVDSLFSAVAEQTNVSDFDLNRDGRLSQADVDTLLVEVLQTRVGDTDLDGDIDSIDFANLSRQFDSDDGSWASGDFDGDGDVDFADFNQLATGFGFERETGLILRDPG